MKRIIEKIYKSLLTYFYYKKYDQNIEKSRNKAYELTRIICFLAVTIPICLVLVFGYDSYYSYIDNSGLMFKLIQYIIALLAFFLSTRFFRQKMDVDFDSIAVGGCDETDSSIKCLTISGIAFVFLNISIVFVLEYFL